MRKKHILMITLSLLLLLQPFLTNNMTTAQIDQFEVDSPVEVLMNTSVKQAIGVGGEEQIKTNFNPNYGFEETDGSDGPEDYNYYGSAFQYTDEFYTGTVNSGTYACRIYGQGNEQFYSNPYVYRSFDSSPEPYLDENIELDFYYYLISNPDIASDGIIYVRLNFQTPAGSRTLYYYLSASSVPTNGSTTGNYDLRSSSPFSVWINFHRDITADFSAIFGVVTPAMYLRYMYVYCQSPPDATGLVQVAVDDFSLVNGAAYDWCSDNGGFEDGDGSNWSGYNRGSGTVMQTDDHTEGNKAINISTTTPIAGVYSDAYVQQNWGDYNTPPLGLYANQQGDFTISFDWKYNDYNPDTSCHAFFYIYGNNASHEAEFTWYLGDDADTVPANSTGSGYTYARFEAPGFGIRDVWNTFSIDMFDYYDEFNITNMPMINGGFRVYAGDDLGATTELLVDDFNIISDPVGDPGFEEDWYYTSSNSIPSWEQTYGDEYISFTSNAHSGDNAANLTSWNANYVSIYRYTYVNVGDNLFSDIWWNMDTIEPTSSGYTKIMLRLDNSYTLNYLVAAGSGYSPSNSTWDYYYYVDNYNEMDTWNLIERNIAEDAVIAFGEENWNITQVYIEVYASGSTKSTLFLDDFHFVRDTTGPQLVSQVLLNTPTYYQDVEIEILMYDLLSRAVYAEVFYNVGTGWSSVVAAQYGSHFYAVIPQQAWGNTVDYYFVMRDSFGSTSTDDNGGSYYSYDIIDNIDPTVQILHVTTSSKGIQSVDVEAFDVGSDIAFVELYDTDILVGNFTTGPFNFTYSDDFEQIDGLRTLVARAVDNAGNEMYYEMVLGVDLPSAFIAFFQTWGTLIGAGIVGTAWVTVVIVKLVKKPKT